MLIQRNMLSSQCFFSGLFVLVVVVVEVVVLSAAQQVVTVVVAAVAVMEAAPLSVTVPLQPPLQIAVVRLAHLADLGAVPLRRAIGA